MAPVVSVIMPALNTGRWIRQAIQSVLVQTLTDVEVLVVDDASTDSTVEVLESIPDERIRLFRQPQNRGVSAARNIALDQARGEWVAILYSDDWFARRDRLMRLVAVGEEYGADLVGDDIYVQDDGRAHAWTTMFAEKRLRLREPTWANLAVFFGHDLEVIKPLSRTAFIREHGLRYDETLKFAEDWKFYVECLLRGGRLVLDPQPGYVYRVRSGSLSRAVVPLLDQMERDAVHYLDDGRLVDQPEAVAALRGRQAAIRASQSYHELVALLRAGSVGSAGLSALRSPDSVCLLLKRIPWVVRRYLRRRLARTPLPERDHAEYARTP